VQVTGCGDTAGYQSGAALATHGYCETRPFRTPYQGPSTQPSPAWTFGLGTAFTGLAIAADGTIYSGTTANQLYALNPDGTQRWVALLPNPVADSPSIGRDGTVYVSTYAYPTTHVVAVDPANGMIKWSQELNNTRGGGTPLLTASNEVIVAANDIVFYSTNGVETRTIVVDDGRSTGPLTRGPAQELYAYIARNDNKVALRRYEPQSLQFPLTWEVIRNMPGIGFSSPTYAALFNNTVISPFWQDVLVTVNKNTGDATPVCCSTPTNYTGGVNVDAFGNSYVRARSGAIAKYRADLIFDGVAGPAIAGEYQDYWVGNAVLDGGGLIVGNWTDGTLRAYNAQLTLIWSLALGATQRGEATPAIAKDGTLIVPTQNGLRAFR
jgi:outer membrane protein assembly factor BamB